MLTETLHHLRTCRLFSAPNWLFQLSEKIVNPRPLFAIRLSLSVCLALFATYWLELQNSFWAATTAAITCQPNLGASLRKGRFRVIGTIIGAMVVVGLLAQFSQQRDILVLSLAIWCGLCGCSAVLLRNNASYAAALSGITATIIFADSLSDPSGAFLLAVTRVGEICIGIGAACIVALIIQADTASGQLSKTLSAIALQLWQGFSETVQPQDSSSDHLALRHTMIRSFPTLQTQVDAAIGESSYIRTRAGNLNSCLKQFLRALLAWRNTEHLKSVTEEETVALRHQIASEFRKLDPTTIAANPIGFVELCEDALIEFKSVAKTNPADIIFSDGATETVKCLQEIARCQALLGERGAPPLRQPYAFPVIVDPLPAALAGLRVFCSVIVSFVFWVETAWPVGYFAAVFAAIATLVFASFADQALLKAKEYSLGVGCMMVIGAILYFGLLPSLTWFSQLLVVLIVFYLVVGFMQTGKSHSTTYLAISVCSLPMLGLGNPTTYDATNFLNLSSAILVGSLVGTCFFAIIPALDPETQEKRLISQSLRDFRNYLEHSSNGSSKRRLSKLAARFCALPSVSTDVPFSQLMAICAAVAAADHLSNALKGQPQLAYLETAYKDLAGGNLQMAMKRLAELDVELTNHDGEAFTKVVTGARAHLVILSEIIREHASLLSHPSKQTFISTRA
ncbi:FUSC family protein [Aliirhizobium cellulosilyticum]|uniref:Putative membrane protein YccC n=1 Tax=Aliirhizobium cellulosilyticum TaxID=393664 RepID=A0A7W6V0T6_9HYPH|nr:FUSC family protein [Rhizobium cellulosilyticum]MBB4349379.1 putative membrane protein YccC [Rhizobium cellulosilyticum]MBB4412399.1 putative membrane protein YccC [Rhizobium cellulosilyticum]MBB4447031.1 putative membrane protein YccC [Rhizobium cellulosilyticum]